jgi:hypothetical protein
MFKFADCTINKVSTQKFLLKNLSGIKTRFKFSSTKFEPPSHVAPKPKSDIEIAKDQEAAQVNDSFSRTNTAQGMGRQIRFAPSTKSAGSSLLGGQTRSVGSAASRRDRPILSDEHEATQKFSSATGTSFTQTKKLEKEASYFLSNNKGIAIVVTPHMGELFPHSEIPITVTVYNNVCGRFDDWLVSEIRGLERVEFPVSIGIKGSPVEIPPNQVGLNYNFGSITLPMPT